VPAAVGRAAVVVAAFALMGAFHVVALGPVVGRAGRWRVGVFFVANGVATAVEGAVWGRRRGWCRAGMAWVFELGVASWTAAAWGGGEGRGWREGCEGW